MNTPKGVKSCVSERAFPAPHVAPATVQSKDRETSHVSQLVNKPFNIMWHKCIIYEQGMYDDHRISEM